MVLYLFLSTSAGRCHVALFTDMEESLMPTVNADCCYTNVSYRKFVPRTLSVQEATLLLSSSNDGSVVLWDLKKQQGDFKSDRKIPPIVFNAHSLHTNGIFSMHELAGQLATGSKDFSLACSMVKEAGITRERVISGHHDGAIRSVRFR